MHYATAEEFVEKMEKVAKIMMKCACFVCFALRSLTDPRSLSAGQLLPGTRLLAMCPHRMLLTRPAAQIVHQMAADAEAVIRKNYACLV